MHHARVQALRKIDGLFQILRHDACGEAILRIVGDLQSFLDVLHRNDGSHGPERLLEVDLHVLADIGQDRRPVDPPFVRPPGEQPGPLGDGVLHMGIHLADGFVVDQRSDHRFALAGIPNRKGGGLLRKPRRELLGDRLFHDHAPDGYADLSLMEEGAKRGRGDGIVHVRVGKDNERILAPELELARLQLGRGPLSHMPARDRLARQIHI
jgi:hypothetical protein